MLPLKVCNTIEVYTLLWCPGFSQCAERSAGESQNRRFARTLVATLRAAGQLQQAGAQMSARHGVEAVVDRLVAEALGIGHTSQCARNLSRTQALAQIVHDALKEC